MKFTLVPHVVGDGEAMAVQVTLTHLAATLVFQADLEPPLLSVFASVPVLVPAELHDYCRMGFTHQIERRL